MPLLLVCLGLGLTLAGVLRLWLPASSEPERPLVFEGLAQEDEAGTTVMPDVLGMDEDAARAALQDAGVPVSAVQTSPVPYVAAVGTVVDQEPIGGVAVGVDDEIRLDVASEASMPDVVGMTQSEADVELARLGVVPSINDVVTTEGEVGKVLRSIPAPGEVIAGEVEVDVAATGDAVLLVQLQATKSTRATRPGEVVGGGTTWTDSIMLTPVPNGEASVDYTISGRALLLLAEIATADDAGAGAATVRVIGDGAVLAEVRAQRGRPVPLRADVTGVVRVVITAAVEPETNDVPRIVLGDARLTGTTTDIDAIVASVGR